MNKKIRETILVIVITMVILFIYSMFSSDLTVQYTPQVEFHAREYVSSMDCINFGDIVYTKYNHEKAIYNWLTFETFANDYDYIAELSIIWDFNTCYVNQSSEVKSFIYKSLQ